MAKKKQAVQELSLFDNSFFDDTPLSQEEIHRTRYLDDIRQPKELSERKQAFHTMLDKMEEDKYKILRVISSLTHELFEVKIIE